MAQGMEAGGKVVVVLVGRADEGGPAVDAERLEGGRPTSSRI